MLPSGCAVVVLARRLPDEVGLLRNALPDPEQIVGVEVQYPVEVTVLPDPKAKEDS